MKTNFNRDDILEKEKNPSTPEWNFTNKKNNSSLKNTSQAIKLAKDIQTKNYYKVYKNIKQTKTKNKSKKSTIFIIIAFLIFLIPFFIIIISIPSMMITNISNSFIENANPTSLPMNNRLKEQFITSVKLTESNDQSKYKISGSFSDKYKEKLIKEGFSFDNNEIRFKNQKITSDNVRELVYTNPHVNHALEQASNIKRASFQDSVWQQNASDLGINQSGYNSKNFKDIKNEELNYTKLNSNYRFKSDDSIPSDIKNNLIETNRVADELQKNQQTSSSKKFNNLATVDKNLSKKTGVCGIYQTSKFLSDYNKTQRLEQASKIAAQIIAVGEKIKAGEASKVEIDYLGNRLTKLSSFSENGLDIKTDSATDSYSYKLLTYGEAGNMDYSANKYVAGANENLSKNITLSDKYFNSVSGKAAKTLCNIGNELSVFDSFFSKIANIISGYKESDFPEITANLNNENSRMSTENTIDSMTGLNISPETSGEDLLNMAYAGWTNLVERSAALSGAPILNKEQKIAYDKKDKELIALRADYERETKSPFDIYSPNTMLGSILQKNMSSLISVSNIPNFIFKFKNNIFSALINILPFSNAKSEINSLNALNLCKDPSIINLGNNIAANPMCIPNRGIEVGYMKKSPNEIINLLMLNKDLKLKDGSCDKNGLNCELIPDNNFKKYIDDCASVSNLKIGIEDAGKKCVADTEIKSAYATYLYDQRVNSIINQ